MKPAIPIAVVAVAIAAISIWMNIDWKKTYQDCDKKKQDCYKVCRATWDAEREEVRQESLVLDSVENIYNQDSSSLVPFYVHSWRTRLNDKRMDNLIKYLKCKEACEEAWEDCVGEE